MTNLSAIANVRDPRNDFTNSPPHNADMGIRKRKPKPEVYEKLKEASGWYLRAWREYRSLTLEELADEVGTSKGVISDLETGAKKANGEPAARFNRDWVEKLGKALDTTGGFLLDVNPYGSMGDLVEITERFRRLDDDARQAVIGLADRLLQASNIK